MELPQSEPYLSPLGLQVQCYILNLTPHALLAVHLLPATQILSRTLAQHPCPARHVSDLRLRTTKSCKQSLKPRQALNNPEPSALNPYKTL